MSKLPEGRQPVGSKWVFKTLMETLSVTRLDWWLRDSHKNSEVIMTRPFVQWYDSALWLLNIAYIYSFTMAGGRHHGLFQWPTRGGSLHGPARGFCHCWHRVFSMLLEEKHIIWAEAVTQVLEHSVE